MPRATEKGTAYFEFLAEQTRGVFEAYYTTYGAVLASDEDGLTAKALRKVAGEQFERAGLLGEVGRHEAANPVTFSNAVDTLVRLRILAHAPGAPGPERSRDAAYVRGEAFDDLTAIHERLATALSAR